MTVVGTVALARRRWTAAESQAAVSLQRTSVQESVAAVTVVAAVWLLERRRTEKAQTIVSLCAESPSRRCSRNCDANPIHHHNVGCQRRGMHSYESYPTG